MGKLTNEEKELVLKFLKTNLGKKELVLKFLKTNLGNNPLVKEITIK
jgi:hypothetical protein